MLRMSSFQGGKVYWKNAEILSRYQGSKRSEILSLGALIFLQPCFHKKIHNIYVMKLVIVCGKAGLRR